MGHLERLQGSKPQIPSDSLPAASSLAYNTSVKPACFRSCLLGRISKGISSVRSHKNQSEEN